MGFVNRYDRSGLLNYYYSEEFQEGSNKFIFSVGHQQGKALITKTKLNGDVIWEKVYTLKDESKLVFNKIIQVTDYSPESPKFHYVAHMVNTGNDANCLMSINGDNGTIEWFNRIPHDNNPVFFDITPCAEEYGFHLIMSSAIDKITYQSIVATINQNGQFLVKRRIDFEHELYFTAMDAKGADLLIAGYFGDSNSTIPFVLNINSNLSSITGFYTMPDTKSIIDDIVSYDQKFLISGRQQNGSIFLAVFGDGDTAISLNMIPKSNGFSTKIVSSASHAYLLQYNSADGFIHKLDFNFSVEWKKGIKFENDQIRTDGINYRNARLTLTCYEPTIGSILANTNIDMQSCKTADYTVETPIPESFEIVNTLVVIEDIDIIPVVMDCIQTGQNPEIITYCPGGNYIDLENITYLQSPNLQLCTAGSTGEDGSSEGIHLRWIFQGILGENHLPKGMYSLNNANFNKADDYLRVYRAAYTPYRLTVDFSVPPNIVNHGQRFWIYKFGLRMFYVYFKDAERYDNTLDSVNPLSDPINFIWQYGDALIEIESKRDLFFVASLRYKSGSYYKTNTEALSVFKNLETAPKYLFARKFYEGIDSDPRIVCENGRTIRLLSISGMLASISFELYEDFITETNNIEGWTYMGEYALTVNDAEAIERLDPSDADVHGNWQRFNDDAYVNTANYVQKWNGPTTGTDFNVKTAVGKYLELSEDATNPTGIMNILIGTPPEPGDPPSDPEDDFNNLPLLDLLNMISSDFHIARVLGLGMLDVGTAATSAEGQYIYVAQYFTEGDLQDGYEPREVQHLSMSLPTNKLNQRLPVPYEIEMIVPGISYQDNLGESLTNEDGYTLDGLRRYVTLLAAPLPPYQFNPPFYSDSQEFTFESSTLPISAGLEYQFNTEQIGFPYPAWIKPELSNDSGYQNAVPEGETLHNETVPLIVSENQAIYVHRQEQSGWHYYRSYGINIFSRSAVSENVMQIYTEITPPNSLLPPSNINALLIRKESPLMLTVNAEQSRLDDVFTADGDPTLVRLTFDYHSQHDMKTYKVSENYDGLTSQQIVDDLSVYPDDLEIYGDEIEIWYRNRTPRIISGKIVPIDDNGSDPIYISRVETLPYTIASTGQIVDLTISADMIPHYLGGKLVIGEQQFVIADIHIDSSGYPTFKLYKNQLSQSIVTQVGEYTDLTQLESPNLQGGDGLFAVVENMQNLESWGYDAVIENDLKVRIGETLSLSPPLEWMTKREVFDVTTEDGIVQRVLEKNRGYWSDGTISEVEEIVELLVDGQPQFDSEGNVLTEMAHNGLYKIHFPGFDMPQHSQYDSDGVSVEWYKGQVRLKTILATANNGQRSDFAVVRIENIADPGGLILYFADLTFTNEPSYDKVETGSQLVNFYPGYRVYLYADEPSMMNFERVFPLAGEGIRNSIMGLRTHDLGEDYFSRFSTPTVMFAEEIVEPVRPLLPTGADYATRPDFFGKSTYTFVTEFAHTPHATLFYRTSEEVLLNALYKIETRDAIRLALAEFGGNDEFYIKARWSELLNLDFQKSHATFTFLPEVDSYHMPLPDNAKFIAAINNFIEWHNTIPGVTPATPLTVGIIALNQQIIAVGGAVTEPILAADFIIQTVQNSFVPLTEMPIIYKYIKPNAEHPETYEPQPQPQNIKDRNGYLLPVTSDAFKMAPMAKNVGDGNSTKVLFTDFTLDGTSKNLYFYGVKEMSNQMQMSEFSPFLGPIKLVNTNAPEVPEIKRIMPRIGNKVLNVTPAVSFEINPYRQYHHIKKINLYRTFGRAEAQSVRMMDLIKEVEIDEEMAALDLWTFIDDFSDLDEVPYNDPLYYRITASRQVEYMEGDTVVTEFAPSIPSKITATIMPESAAPESPVLSYYGAAPNPEGEVKYITLWWNKTVYKGKYHLFKMNAQGNWIKIWEGMSNDDVLYLPLEQTNLNSSTLSIRDANEKVVYHHFKVLAQNTSGVMSSAENILTIYDPLSWNDLPGIGDMIIDSTFIITED